MVQEHPSLPNKQKTKEGLTNEEIKEHLQANHAGVSEMIGGSSSNPLGSLIKLACTHKACSLRRAAAQISIRLQINTLPHCQSITHSRSYPPVWLQYPTAHAQSQVLCVQLVHVSADNMSSLISNHVKYLPSNSKIAARMQMLKTYTTSLEGVLLSMQHVLKKTL